MSTTYESDIVAWATEQAALLRSGNFAALDIEHIADEVEDVGKSEKRELAGRLAVLLTHLLKWQFQPARRGKSWRDVIKFQRDAIATHLEETPSLEATLRDERWWRLVWGDATTKTFEETGLGDLPETCPWSWEQILDMKFPPDKHYDKAQLLYRACLRVATVIRGMWEESGSSDTRLLDALLIPDRLTIAGQSHALKDGEKSHREHVVPRLVIIEECHRRLCMGASDSELADLISANVRIVLITQEECRRLDRRENLGFRQTMPPGWLPGSDPFARVRAAGIEWEDIGPAHEIEVE